MLNQGALKLKIILVPFVLFSFLLMLNGAIAEVGEGVSDVKPTPYSMDLYGSIEGVEEGDIVQVFDPDNVLCGEFVVNKAGQYGFLHVYGDDPGTDVDEGAKRGDTLRLEFDGEELMPISNEEIVWTGDRQRIRVDF